MEYLITLSCDSPSFCVKIDHTYFMEIFGYTVSKKRCNSMFASLGHSQLFIFREYLGNSFGGESQRTVTTPSDPRE